VAFWFPDEKSFALAHHFSSKWNFVTCYWGLIRDRFLTRASSRAVVPSSIDWQNVGFFKCDLNSFLITPFAEQDRLQRKDGYRNLSLCGRVERNKIIVIRETISTNEDILPHTVHDDSVILLRVRTFA
jgi:hypothetical protein